jgi:hypothetical protein
VAIALAGAVLSAVACGGHRAPRPAQPPAPAHPATTVAPPTTAAVAHGLGLRLPPGWHAGRVSLTPHVPDPREVVAAATFPLRYRDLGCGAQIPVSALRDLGDRGAFVALFERGRGANGAGFPPRPAHFGPRLGGPSEAVTCVPGIDDHWFTFSDRGRLFHAEVSFGPHPTAATRAQAWRLLDALRVDPNRRPDWRSAP